MRVVMVMMVVRRCLTVVEVLCVYPDKMVILL